MKHFATALLAAALFAAGCSSHAARGGDCTDSEKYRRCVEKLVDAGTDRGDAQEACARRLCK